MKTMPGKLGILLMVIVTVLAGCKPQTPATNQTTGQTTPNVTANVTPTPPPVPPTGTNVTPVPPAPGNNVTPPPPPPQAPVYTVGLGNSATLGGYLTDGAGRTLYYYARDTAGKSNATNATIQSWPVFYTGNVIAPSGVQASDFGVITRSDGAMQSTYNGWPLYYYGKDQAPGDTLGNGLGGNWFVIKIPFYTVMLMNKTGVGSYLADGNGMTLYWTTLDSAGKSNIDGNLLATWPLFNPQTVIIPSSLNSTDFTVLTRPDISQQLCYKGYPLYTYAGDRVSGDTLGDVANGKWFAVNVSADSPVPPTVAGVPTLQITFPIDGATLPAGNIAVIASVTNFNIVDKQGQANVAGEGHLHFYLDVAAPVTPGQPAVPATNATWAHVSGNTYTFTNVAPGTHTITVQLVNNDHTPVIPAVIATITVIVILI